MNTELTPLQTKYFERKTTLPAGTLLMIRMGDFYEFFGDDAAIAARTLNIALTRRGKTPMAGIPYHAFESYVRKLTQAGFAVATMDLKSGEWTLQTPEVWL